VIKKKYLKIILAVFVLVPIVLIYQTIERTLEGEQNPTDCFEGDCVNGKGHYFFDAKLDYSGEFQDGKPNGWGVMTNILDTAIKRESGTWKAGEPVDTEIWTLRQIGLLDETHSWWYSPESINHTDEYTEYVELDNYVGSSVAVHVQLDCENNKVRPTHFYFFNDVMALGGAVAEAPSDLMPLPDEWFDIQTQPKAELYTEICEAKRLATEAEAV